LKLVTQENPKFEARNLKSRFYRGSTTGSGQIQNLKFKWLKFVLIFTLLFCAFHF